MMLEVLVRSFSFDAQDRCYTLWTHLLHGREMFNDCHTMDTLTLSCSVITFRIFMGVVLARGRMKLQHTPTPS